MEKEWSSHTFSYLVCSEESLGLSACKCALEAEGDRGFSEDKHHGVSELLRAKVNYESFDLRWYAR